ncbi:substrate-binding periplasmic protein [Motiliproteus coralliicola]|uniref:substrate-binding periplasmic protein n=1 Tax=Motiliproteus coralliicola TaxID=2283196 RepID=UPI001401F179|nr:transporter substrate-binding domain-containing protein [Motiliproteus coralliicola]
MSAKPVLKLAATEWAPYTSVTLASGGVASELVTAAFNQVGYDVEVMVYPWQRAQHMVKQGVLDGMAIAWYTEERNLRMLYSRPYLKTEIVLLKHRSDLNTYGDEEMEGKLFAVMRGYGYLGSIPAKHYRTSVSDSLEQSLLMLGRKRVDLVLEERLQAHHKLALLPRIDRDKIHFGRSLEVRPLHLTISRGHPQHRQIIDDFNRGLALLIERGEYARILANYEPAPLSVAD